MRAWLVGVGVAVATSIFGSTNSHAAACGDASYFKGLDGCYYRTIPGFILQCDVRSCDANKPTQASSPTIGKLNINPPTNGTQLRHDHLYIVEVTVQRTKEFGKPSSGLLDQSLELTTHTIGLINTNLTAAALPNATDASTLLLLPIYSVTGAPNNVAVFDNTESKYHRSFLISGRDQPNIVAMASAGKQLSPSAFGNTLYGLLNLITPLTPFLGGFGALIKADAPAISATQTPYAALLQQLDKSYSTTTVRPLLIAESGASTKTTIVTDYTTTTLEVTDFYEANKDVKLTPTPPPGASATAKQAAALPPGGPYLLQDNPDQALVSGFEKVFDALSTAVIKPASGVPLRQICSQIGRSLQFDRNLSRADTAYAMAHIVYLSGLTKSEIIECLGSEYGPIAVRLTYWKNLTKGDNPQLPTISSWEFPPDNPEDLQQPTFDRYATAYQQFALDLNAYATRATTPGFQPTDDAAMRLRHYFEDQVILIDTTGTTASKITIPIKQLPSERGVQADVMTFFLSLVMDGKYHKYGCPVSDAQTSSAPDASNDTTNSKSSQTGNSQQSSTNGASAKNNQNNNATVNASTDSAQKDNSSLKPSGQPSPWGRGAAVAMLAFKESESDTFKADDALVLRFWLDAPMKPDWSPFNRIELSYEPASSSAILAANNNKCSLSFAIQSSTAPTPGH